jgi:hypothetical protein
VRFIKEAGLLQLLEGPFEFSGSKLWIDIFVKEMATDEEWGSNK